MLIWLKVHRCTNTYTFPPPWEYIGCVLETLSTQLLSWVYYISREFTIHSQRGGNLCFCPVACPLYETNVHVYYDLWRTLSGETFYLCSTSLHAERINTTLSNNSVWCLLSCYYTLHALTHVALKVVLFIHLATVSILKRGPGNNLTCSHFRH